MSTRAIRSDLAARYDREGADELVFYDITASAEGRDIMVDLVERVASQVFIPLSVGGGVRTVDDMYRMLRSGAEKVSINSAAHRTPDLISACANRFGSQCVVLSIDALRDADSDVPRWTVYLNGGRVRTELDAVETARRGQELGAGEIVLNSYRRRWHARGLRRGLSTRRYRPGVDSSGRLGRRRVVGASSRRGHARARTRGAGGLDFSLRGLHRA